LYLFLLAVQTVGAVLFCGQVLPIYRRALANPRTYGSETTLLAVAGAVLIQLGYWTSYRLRPVLPLFTNVVLGHVLLFAARLLFVLATSVFSFLFIAKTMEAEMPILLLLGLFSLFCYVRELERLGNHLLRKPQALTAE
jgi:cobalamin biosynthesis protein CobD/CbiB